MSSKFDKSKMPSRHITDGRFSGATRGFRICAEIGEMSVALDYGELTARREQRKPRDRNYQSGVQWRDAATAGPADKGAVTHPGGAPEISCFADI